MNQLIILGNGFDLAHGLKTSYKDFIIWYFNQAFAQFNKSGHYSDNLISLKSRSPRFPLAPELCMSIEEALKVISSKIYEFDYNSRFFEELIEKNNQQNWVDIENEYYKTLIRHYKILEKAEFSDNRRDQYIEKINELHSNIRYIESLLCDYLKLIDQRPDKNETIEKHFNEIISNKKLRSEWFCILNFNYTKTIEVYERLVDNAYAKINIHGSIHENQNPIIFGYGDEMDEHYAKLENLNHDETLSLMKSFGYFKSANYSKLKVIINTFHYEVLIMGHSCGISDRVLLNQIFENRNCKSIKIYYHKIDEDNNDYFEKTIKISRHFKDKISLREKIVPFPDCSALSYSEEIVEVN